MLVTIEEAKNKLCVMPFPAGRTTCRADECMAWRFGDWETVNVGKDRHGVPSVDYDHSKPTRGYCGLVGKP